MISRTVISRAICGSLFTLAGVLHFLHPDFYMKIMPPWLPLSLELIYVSGLFEILGGVGLFISKIRRLSVWLLLILLLAVFPANIHMACHPDIFSKIPVWLLYLRLPLQGLIMLWVWRCK